ncbi:sigma-54-dependent transcriptional regulator [Caldithrix abyssi]
MRILIIEDEKISRITLNDLLKKEGYDVSSVETGTEGLTLFEREAFDLVLADLRLPGADGIEVLRQVKSKKPRTVVILMTAYGTVDTAVQALKMGAYDYLTKPFTPDHLLNILRNAEKLQRVLDENQQLKKRLEIIEKKPIIGASPAMRHLQEIIHHVARHDSTVLIVGESGTGKELVARALHENSWRKDQPFWAVNCAAIPETLLESELFGYEKGAFTGAAKRHLGYFERANHGTLFIDDIDDLPMKMQVKLLRVLQEQELIRIGGWESVKIDVRVIAANKVDLKQRMKEGRFREDLFYRLNIIPIVLPPLRERKEDIPQLIKHFLQKQNAAHIWRLFSPELLQRLSQYDWPGNVRELENFVERFVAFSGMESFDPFSLLPGVTSGKEQPLPENSVFFSYHSFNDFMAAKEKEIIDWAMKQTNNNISKAADLLKLPRTTLRSKLEKINRRKSGGGEKSVRVN